MNSFGLGLILNFTDNATAGINGATRAFQQMSATADSVSSSVSTSVTDIVSASYALDAVGDTLIRTGSSIIGVFADVSQSVIDSGMQMQGYRMQLSALYGSMDAGELKMKEIKDYAMSSVFDIQSLIPAVTTMKAVGIEAMAEITTSSGQHTQKLLDYASDLAAMMPNMRNAYGTGVAATMGAFKEYIAEGNAMSLKRGAGLDITGLLGEAKGSTIEERTQQVADLIEQLNIIGYTTNLAGTPTQRLSNMQDALFNSLTKVADSGVFEKYCDLLETLSNWVFTLVEDEETFNLLTGVLADTITTLLSPLEKLLNYLIENSNAIIGWIKENPKLTKNILLTVAAIGGFLVAGGLFLKLISSIGMASAGLKFLKGLPTLLGTIGGSMVKLTFKSLPFIALAGAAYVIWKKNIFGIRDTVTEAVKDLSDIFTVIGDAWGDNTLSEENYNLAESLGILSLIESLLMLKYYWGYFVEGFKKGFEGFLKSLEETLGVFGIDVSDTFAKVGEFLKTLFDIGQEDQWTNIGETVGKIAGIAVVLFTLFKVLTLFKPLLGLFKGGIPFLGGKNKGLGAGGNKPFDGIINVFSSLAKAKPTTVLKGMLNLGIILGGLAIIAGAIMAVSPYLAELTDIQSFLEVVLAITILGVVGTGLAKLSGIAGKIPVGNVAKGLANIAIIMGGLGALLAVLGLISMIPFDLDRTMQIVVVIGIIGIIGTALSLLSAVIGLIPVAVVALGLANIAIIMGGLAVLYLAIGALTQLGVSADDMLQVVVILGIIGVIGGVLSALAALVGLIPFPLVLAGIANIASVVGALTGLALLISEALPTIGKNLNDFIVKMQPAFDIFSKLGDVDMRSIGDFFVSFGAFMLQLGGNKIISFFTGKTDLNSVANGLVSFATTSKQAFDIFAQFPKSSFDNLFGVLSAIEAMSGVVLDVSLLNTMSSKGYNAGRELMTAIASSIIANAYRVRSALNTALGSISVTASPSVSVRANTNHHLVGLSTGGYVKDTGVAVLHPDEVVVNDDTTKKLQNFLNQNSGSLVKADSTVTKKEEVNNDYSITFEAGSVVIQIANATEAELEKAAEKLMKIIERKQQLKAMAVRA